MSYRRFGPLNDDHDVPTLSHSPVSVMKQSVYPLRTRVLVVDDNETVRLTLWSRTAFRSPVPLPASSPQLFLDCAGRLHAFKPLGSKELKSESANRHGLDRRRQGDTAAMVVEERRILQVTMLQTLQKNLGMIDFSVL